jgi:predicted metal-binding protein
MTHTLMVCELCRFSETEREQDGLSGGQHLLAALQSGLEADHLQEQIQLRPVRCMGACGRSCVLAFAAPEKLTFVFHQWSPQSDIADVLMFSRQYLAAANGNVPYKERPIALRSKLMVVLPGVPLALQQDTLL